MKLDALLDGPQLLVCVGPGGVGKTTVAAALGLEAASRGRRVLVLTVDPARRLAEALGLTGVGDAVHRVDLPGGHALDVAMVEAGPSYEALIRRESASAEVRQQILENRVFRAVSRSLARSHAYVAMERVHHAMASGRYDLIVVDTPPARNALEILDAPGHLVRFLDAKVVGWLLPAQPRGFRARLWAGSGRVARHLLSQLTGEHLLTELLEFFAAVSHLRAGFAERATHLQSLLRSDRAGYVLVSSANATAADDAACLLHDLGAREIAVDLVVFNRAHIVLATAPLSTASDVARRTRAVAAELGPEAEAAIAGVAARRSAAQQDNRHRGAVVDGLRAELPAGCTTARVPWLDDEPCDLDGLQVLAAALASA